MFPTENRPSLPNAPFGLVPQDSSAVRRTEEILMNSLFARPSRLAVVVALPVLLAAKPLADLDATWANNPGHAAGHTKNVYNSFKRF